MLCLQTLSHFTSKPRTFIGICLCPAMASKKRRLREDSKRDNDHNEVSVLANSFHFPVHLSN
jgi:hypothetical protein